jgi:serine/threonine protein phosphatase PrpC
MDELLSSPEGQQELRDFRGEVEMLESNAGCTANVVLIHKKNIYCANSGDSRTILSKKKISSVSDKLDSPEFGCWIPLSTDHKPDGKIEKDRITNAGGFIVDGRFFIVGKSF